MIRSILPENVNFYKANLHCHTTFSDGSFTPEQVKKAYSEAGYSIVAYTDHDVFVRHPELRDENFLPLYGFELEFGEGKNPWVRSKSCHICFVSLDEDNPVHPLWHRSKYLFGGAKDHRDDVVFDPDVPDFEREYTPECINEAIRIGREHNFFVTYNHPAWSLESYPEYSRYEGMDAMEIVNYGSVALGYFDHNGAAYDDLLREGKRLFCTATDDNHNRMHGGSEYFDSFGGFTMIAAKELTYEAISSALKKGEFYSSEGPEIYSLSYDTETRELRVATSPAARIICTSAARRSRIMCGSDPKVYVSEAVFTLDEYDDYARITVIDGNGKCAYSNAIFDL